MNTEITTEAPKIRAPFKALGLRAGMALSIQRLAEGAPKQDSQYFGVMDGKGVMIGTLGPESEFAALRVGDICMVRGFTGQYEYSFLCEVLHTLNEPTNYAILSHPLQVDARLIRHSKRAKASWPTSIRLLTEQVTTKVTLVDIGTTGAMVRADKALTQVGGSAEMVIDIAIEGLPHSLTLLAELRHCNKTPTEDGYFLGFEFKEPNMQDFLALYYITQSPQG